jgi:hypothetical protein
MWLKKLEPWIVLHMVPAFEERCARKSAPLRLVTAAPSLPASDLALSAIQVVRSGGGAGGSSDGGVGRLRG